jgi:catechol-2,3-dioxygenase
MTTKNGKARALGINHVVLEVGSVDEALEFYGAIFDLKLRGRGEGRAFIDMGDQFIQISENRTQEPDGQRHFGLVVDDRDAVRRALAEAGVKLIGKRLNFRDPWGNRIEIVAYDNVQFTKAEHVLLGMGVGEIAKTPEAIAELAEKGMAPG